jgi:hypothetical protein
LLVAPVAHAQTPKADALEAGYRAAKEGAAEKK